MAHYVIANKLYPTGAALILRDNVDVDWRMCDNVLHLSVELPVSVFSADGMLVYDGEASTHDLNGLSPGMYIAHFGQHQVKLIIK